MCALSLPQSRKIYKAITNIKAGMESTYKNSFQIAIDLFSVEKGARDVDAWLEEIIDSEFELQGYMELIKRQQNADFHVQVLGCLMAGYASLKGKVSFSFALVFLFVQLVISSAIHVDRY
jgi:hypothetical protein